MEFQRETMRRFPSFFDFVALYNRDWVLSNREYDEIFRSEDPQR